MATEIVFLPFHKKDLWSTMILLQEELDTNFKKVGLEIKFSPIEISENGGQILTLENESQKAEVYLDITSGGKVHLDRTSGRNSIHILLYSNDKYVDDSPIITSPEELAAYFPSLVNFLRS